VELGAKSNFFKTLKNHITLNHKLYTKTLKYPELLKKLTTIKTLNSKKNLTSKP
jgi:hypothetical protein